MTREQLELLAIHTLRTTDDTEDELRQAALAALRYQDGARSFRFRFRTWPPGCSDNKHKIHAIMGYRYLTGKGLREAKAYIEGVRTMEPGLSSSQVSDIVDHINGRSSATVHANDLFEVA